MTNIFSSPTACNCRISVSIVATIACSLIGSKIPLVPSTDSPPSMPSFGLNVRFARASPSGIQTVMCNGSLTFAFSHTSATAANIICRGTRLIAACPTACSRPSFVTRPMPIPPSNVRYGNDSLVNAQDLSWLPSICSRTRCFAYATVTQTSVPFVTSGSSPLSFTTL